MKNHFGEFDPEVLQVLKDAYNQDANSFAEGCDDTFDFKTCRRSDGTTYGVPDKSDCAQKGAKEVKPKKATSSWDDSKIAGKLGLEAAPKQAGIGAIMAGTAAAAIALPFIKKIFDSDTSLNPSGPAKIRGSRTYKGAANYKPAGGKVEYLSVTLNIGPDGVYKGTWSDGVKADYKFKPNGKVDITSYTTQGTSSAEANWYQTGNKTVITSKNGSMTTINPSGVKSAEFEPRTGGGSASRPKPTPKPTPAKPRRKPTTSTSTKTVKPGRDYQREAGRSPAPRSNVNDSTRELNRQIEADRRASQAAHERRMQSMELDNLRRQNQQLLDEMRRDRQQRQTNRMFDDMDRSRRESAARFEREQIQYELDKVNRDRRRQRTRDIQRQLFGGF